MSQGSEQEVKQVCGIEARVVNFIGFGLLICLAGGLVITFKRDTDSAWVEKVALVLAGGLIALLANTRNQGTPQNPTSTIITNPPNNPVPVEETK